MELIKLRRTAVLSHLNNSFKLRHFLETAAAEAWTVQQLLPHVEPKIAEQILIDRKVKEMDPDFSFCEAIGVRRKV